MKVREALPIATQIAGALGAAHQKGVVHRDLKPANVKLRPGGSVKVLDFGLAAVAPILPEERTLGSETSDSRELTEPGMLLGTAAYMSPEQVGHRTVDQRTDIWAFGVVLFEMLTGTQPFAGQTTADVLASVTNDEPQWYRAPRQLRPFLKACLHKNPPERPHDFAEAMRLLERVALGIRWKRRGRWAVAAVLILGLASFRLRSPNPDQALLQMEITVPEGFTLGPTGDYALRLSPDGRLLVFPGTRDGKLKLWVRRLNSNSTTLLPGTNDGIFPFWSPDSRWVGFFADGKLKKIDVTEGAGLRLSGSEPQVICEDCRAGARNVQKYDFGPE